MSPFDSGVAIHRLTMYSHYGTTGRSKGHACLGLPDALASKREQGNHTPSPGAKLRKGKASVGPFQQYSERKAFREQVMQII